MDEAIDFVDQKINEPSMMQFNINSLYSTIQYIIDFDNWKHPDKLKKILESFIASLHADKLPETYSPSFCSNLCHLLRSIVNHSSLIAVLGEEWGDRLRSLLNHYCHICHTFIIKDEEFTLHMKDRHCLPPVCPMEHFSCSFLNLLTNQAVKEFSEVCPHEDFYTTR